MEAHHLFVELLPLAADTLIASIPADIRTPFIMKREPRSFDRINGHRSGNGGPIPAETGGDKEPRESDSVCHESTPRSTSP